MNWPQYAAELDRGLRQLLRAASETARLQRARYRIRPPTTLQFPVNDICDSRCVMCDVWKQKKDHEISPAELARVLREPFFRQVRFVGLSGGEPTLRRDLPEIGEALCTSLPQLAGIHIISNALRGDRVLDSLRQLDAVARNYGKKFHVNVSIDGIGAMHDQHRGRDGNFASAVRVIRMLREEGIPVGIGCTLTAVNAHYADDVLEWSEAEGIHPVYFRLGVDIRRLYNEGFQSSHVLSREQRFHLTMFFEKLTTHTKMDGLRRQVSASLAGQIWDGAPRTAGCQWQDDGLTLDSRGDVSFCSVASDIVGSALDKGAEAVVRENTGERRRILRDKCSECQHDLIGPLPPKVLASEAWNTITQPWRRDFAVLRRWTARPIGRRLLARGPRRPGPSGWRSVLITGWYGTETAGDKAILGALFQFLRRHAPDCKRIALCTLNRRVCEQTLHELGEDSVELVPLAAGARSRLIAQFDAVIVGGGPLFPIPPLQYIQEQFEAAVRHRCARVLFGCGVGPLGGNRDVRPLVRIIQLATAGFYRDEESRATALRFGGKPELGVGFDPSLAFLCEWLRGSGDSAGETGAGVRRVAVLVRANTTEYVHDIPREVLDNVNSMKAMELARALQGAGASRALEASLLPMHCLHVGGDDRLFNRRIEAFGAGGPCTFRTQRAYLPLPDLLARINGCNISLPMRYHGHMFSLALAKPFVSIDYSGGGGKVANLVRRLGWEDYAVRWADLRAPDVTRRIDSVLSNEAALRDRLLEARSGFLATLDGACEELAGV